MVSAKFYISSLHNILFNAAGNSSSFLKEAVGLIIHFIMVPIVLPQQQKNRHSLIIYKHLPWANLLMHSDKASLLRSLFA